jgi:glutathione S-transferase
VTLKTKHNKRDGIRRYAVLKTAVDPKQSNSWTGWLKRRLDHMERILKERQWLVAHRFTVADLLMADVLRVANVRSFGDRPATVTYLTRMTERSAFKKAHADQFAHFAAAG